MPFDGVAQWQIDILAADKTAAAFSSLNRRVDAAGKQLGVVTDKMNEQGGVLASLAARQNQFSLGMATVARLAGPMAGIFGSLAVAQRAWDAGMQSGALIDQAVQLGVTTDLLQAYRGLAQGAGVDAAQLDGAMQRLNGQMGQAKGGNDEAIDRFDKLGVKLLDAQGRLRGVSDIMPEVAVGLLRMSSDAERNAAAQELFGRAGARIVTMLPELAKGNAAVTQAARDQGTVVEKDVLEAWNKLDNEIKKVNKQIDAFLVTVGAPIATAALDEINKVLKSTREEIEAIVRGWQFVTNTRPLATQLAAVDRDIQAFRDRGYADSNPVMQDLFTRRNALSQQMANQPVVLPPVTVTPPGASNPPKKGAGAAAAKLDDRLKELENERKTLERALAAFDARGTESVAEVDRRLDAQVKLDKKIFDVLKDVPPNSPLAARLTEEAVAISKYTQQLDEKKRLLTEGESVTQRYGDGTRVLAREVAQLDKLLAANAITQGTYNAALKATTLAADDQARAYRAAAGGADAFIAGIEQGMADLARANAEFELGKRIVDDTSQAISDLASGAEVDFNRILLGWITMWAQMEMRAAASSLWNMLGGKSEGGGGGGLGGLLISGISSLLGSFGGGGWEIGPVGGAYNGGGSMSYGGPRAAGGRVSPGNWYMVGERGPEPFIPDSAGTILPNGSMGGSTTIVVNQTVHIGEYVTATEHRKGLAAIKKAAEDGAYARVVDERRRGGTLKKVFG